MRVRGLTLVEVVLATTILSLGLLLLGLSASTSTRVTQSTQPRVIAAQASQLLVERLRGQPHQVVYSTNWSSTTLSVATVDGVRCVVGGDASASFAQVTAEVLDPVFDRRVMSPPSAGPSLALRFLDEATYNSLCGTALDLDGDGSTTGTLPAPGSGAAAPGYVFYPVQVIVRWRDRGGDRKHVLLAALTNDAPQDPNQ